MKRKQAPRNIQQSKTKRRRSAYHPKMKYATKSPEIKFYDFSKTATTLATTGTLTTASCHLIAQGVDESQRIGRKICLTKIMLRGYIKIPGQTAIADAANRVRIIIFHDRQANKNATAINGSALLQNDSIDDFRNLDNSKRFKFLVDDTILLNTMSGGGNGTADRFAEVQQQFSYYKDLNVTVNFDSTLGAITELTENNIGIIVWCDAFTTTAPQIIYKGRVRYTDN